MSRRGDSDLIADWFREAGLTVIAHGVSVEDVAGDLYEQTVAPYLELPWLRYVTTAAEMRQAKQDGVIASYGNCQPDSSIPHDLGAIDLGYSRGLRSLMLTYNSMTTVGVGRPVEHTSELQSLMRRSTAVFCLTKNKTVPHT